MKMTPDVCYQLLEVDAGASQPEIKQAYKDLAKVWHPDRFTDDPRLQQKAEEKLKRINAAYAFLKTYDPKSAQNGASAAQGRTKTTQKPSTGVVLNCDKLERWLAMGNWKEADLETTNLLLELTGRKREGWLPSDGIKAIDPEYLTAIDDLWSKHSGGLFGFAAQRQIWSELGCKASNEITTQTVSETRFGKTVRWHVNGNWLTRWDPFDYDAPAVKGRLPRDYIFALQGWQSYSKGWIGYLIWRFDELFLRLKIR